MKSLLPISPNSTRGFTLIEILIVSVIMVILMGAIAMLFISANKSWSETEAKLQVYQNAREVLSRMSKEIACAYQDDLSEPQQQLGVNSGSYTYSVDGGTYDRDRILLTAAINVNPDPGEYDLSHLGFRLDTSSSNEPSLDRYKKNYDGDYNGSPLDTFSWKELAVNIIGLNIRCYDGSNWFDTWSDSELPKVVEISITAQDKQQRLTQTFETTICIPLGN